MPYVEDGTLSLIGATTENPSFQLNNALLSRCRVIVLEKLTPDHITAIVNRALGVLCVTVSRKANPTEKFPKPSEKSDQDQRQTDAACSNSPSCDDDDWNPSSQPSDASAGRFVTKRFFLIYALYEGLFPVSVGHGFHYQHICSHISKSLTINFA